MLKILIDFSNIILTCTSIRSTACERSHLNLFVFESAVISNFDLRTLKKTMIYIDDLTGILNEMNQLRSQLYSGLRTTDII